MEGHLEGEQLRLSQKSRRSLDKLETSKYSNVTAIATSNINNYIYIPLI